MLDLLLIFRNENERLELREEFKSGDYYHFTMVMFESADVCSKYSIAMEVHEQDSTSLDLRHSLIIPGNIKFRLRAKRVDEIVICSKQGGSIPRSHHSTRAWKEEQGV